MLLVTVHCCVVGLPSDPDKGAMVTAPKSENTLDATVIALFPAATRAFFYGSEEPRVTYWPF